MNVKPGNSWSIRMEMERERQRALCEWHGRQQARTNSPFSQPFHGQEQQPQPVPNIIMPYPQPFYGTRPQYYSAQVEPIWWNPSNPPTDLPELRDERGRPLTTWSQIDDVVQEQESPGSARTPIYRHITPVRRSVTDPTTPGRQALLHNQYAERRGGIRRRGTFNWRPFVRGRKNNNNPLIHQGPIDTIRNTNLNDPALGFNQPVAPMGFSRESPDSILMPRRTPPARYAALHNQQTAPMPAHLSTTTVRTNATTQSQYFQPIQNDAVMIGNAPMIPTRDGNYAATGMPRTVQGQPVTSMTGVFDFSTPTPARHSFAPVQPTPLPRIVETPASNSPANRNGLSGGIELHPFPTGVLNADSQQKKTPKKSSPRVEYRSASDPTKRSRSNTILSPSAATFEPGRTFVPPANAQFTIEQLITRVDRLQLKQEQDRQLLMQWIGRQTQDRADIIELKDILGLNEGGKSVNIRRDVSVGEIGAGWYNNQI